MRTILEPDDAADRVFSGPGHAVAYQQLLSPREFRRITASRHPAHHVDECPACGFSTSLGIIERCAQLQPREALAPGKLPCCREFLMALMRVGCRVSASAHDLGIVGSQIKS